MMDSNNIVKSYLSITSPGTHLVDGDHELARTVTREANEYAAKLKQSRPDRFGFWASLPLPDVAGSLEELRYALDELDADGEYRRMIRCTKAKAETIRYRSGD